MQISQLMTVFLYNCKDFFDKDALLSFEESFYELVVYINENYISILKVYQLQSGNSNFIKTSMYNWMTHIRILESKDWPLSFRIIIHRVSLLSFCLSLSRSLFGKMLDPRMRTKKNSSLLTFVTGFIRINWPVLNWRKTRPRHWFDF